MLRGLYDWTMGLSAHPRALWALAAISFIESSFFPIPPDVLLIAMVLAAPSRAWVIAAVCTASSVLGGLAGYAIGWGLYEAVGVPIIEFYGYADKYAFFQTQYQEWGAWIVFGAGLTPIPYKVFTIASGVADMNLVAFTGASLVSRGLRFFLVAALLWKFGPPIRTFIEAHLGKLTIIFFVLLFGSFVLLKYLL